MSHNKKYIDVMVVGSGLSSLTFIETYLEKRKKIDVISPELNLKFGELDKKNDHIFKILPPQMSGKENNVRAFFQYNDIEVDKNCKLFGSLEFGGLSNYWGLQIDPNIIEDIKDLSKKTQKNIINCFFELVKKLNLIGKLKIKNKILDNELNYIDIFNLKKIKRSKLKISSLILGLENKNKKKELDAVNEKKDKLTPINYYQKYLRNKKIKFHNYFVKAIKDSKNGIELICSNNKEVRTFITKKLVLATGTIITTKLIASYLHYKKEIKLGHHPRLFTLFFLKKKWLNKMVFQPPIMHIKSKFNSNLFTTDFRPGNKLIINSIIDFKKYLYPFKFILTKLRFNFLFLNTFLNPKFGNIFLKLDNDNVLKIYSKNKKISKIFKKISLLIYNLFRKTKKIFPFQINYFPGFGADFHYFGTININGKGNLSVNENCQLKKNKNIYIVDGSVFNFNKNKYPIGLIMANSRRVAKELTKK